MKKSKGAPMKKRTAIVWLSLISVLIVLASIFSFIHFQSGIYDYKGVLGAIKLGIDLKGGVYVVLEPKLEFEEGEDQNDEALIKEKQAALNDSIDGTIEILRKRLTSKGYTEATVVEQYSLGQSAGVKRIRIEIPDVTNPQEVMSIIGKQAKLEFREAGGNVGEEATGAVYKCDDGKGLGQHVLKASKTYDENGKPAVALKFDAVGTKTFSKITQDLVSSNGVIVIAVDGVIVSAPTVQVAITNGESVITGMSSLEEADNLALQIQSGALPMTFTEIEPKVISPTLGDAALRNSLIAGGIGLLLVFIFMIVVYRGLGIIADIALIIYTLIVLFLLAVLPWVQLTIQGIAGIVLSIGMAVDANVIIFERIKDEYKQGKTLKAAQDAGFKRALSAILDSNITTIIASVVLWVAGTGSIKGFGITLFIGIIVSMFTALFVTRILVKLFYPLNKSEKFYKLKREEVAE